MNRHPVDDEASAVGEEPRLGDRLIDDDRLIPGPLRTIDGVAAGETQPPRALAAGRRLDHAVKAVMALAGEHFEALRDETARRSIPVDLARGFVDQERLVIGIVEPEVTGAESESAVGGLQRAMVIDARAKIERDRHVGLEPRAIGAHHQDIVKAEVARLDGKLALGAGRNPRRDAPGAGWTRRGDRDRGAGTVAIVGERKTLVGERTGERLVVDVQMTVDDRDVIERLFCSRQRFDSGRGERAGIVERRAAPGGRSEGEARRILAARRRDRDFAVLGDMKIDDQAVKFEPAHADVESQQRQDVEADIAARRRDQGAALSVGNANAAKAQPDAKPLGRMG